MTTIKNHGGIDILRLPVNQEEHSFPPWHVKYTQSHILHSKCSRTPEPCGDDDPEACQFCTYNRSLNLPHMPDMVFPNNVLIIKDNGGATITFGALDALRRVSNGKINLQLACADAWKESRSESSEYLEEKIKPFDWTFATDYMGTISGFNVEETDEKIDVEKLRRKEKILFYHDLTLFEDELHDNGIAVSSVKIRVMPSSFFVLLRYFLRVDNVMLKINDTRLFHEFGQEHILREYTSREAKVKDLRVSPVLFTEPNEIASYLPVTEIRCDKLTVAPKSDSVEVNREQRSESTSSSNVPTPSSTNDTVT